MKKLTIIALILLLVTGCAVSADNETKYPISLIEVVQRMLQRNKLKGIASHNGTARVTDHINGNHSAIVESTTVEKEKSYMTLEEISDKMLCEEHLEVLAVKTELKDGLRWFYLDTKEESSGLEETIYAVYGQINSEILFVEPGDKILAKTLENTQMMNVQILEKAKN